MSRSTITACFLGALCSALLACGGSGVREVVPSIRVRATHVDEKQAPLVDFGASPVLVPTTRIIEIENLGRAELHLRTLAVEATEAVFSLGEDLADLRIPGGSSVELPVIFRPQALASYSGVLLIENNDRKQPTVQVGLEGDGSTIGRLAYDPEVIDFGIVGEWTQATRSLRLQSVGSAPLIVEGAALAEESSPAFGILGSSRSTRLSAPSDELPGGEVSLTLSCSPTDETEGTHIEGVLTLQSSDPDRQEVSIPIRAQINRAPLADFEIGQENRTPYGEVALDGSLSHDPDGHTPLNYTWRIHRQPAGATATISDPSSATPSFSTDMPGEYVIGLDVEDALGLPCRPPEGDLSAPCTTKNLEIRADHDLEILLVWDKTTDLDLHLVEEGGDFFGPDACFWGNPSPDFGEIGNPEDDPFFANEGTSGGREEIIFSRPSPGRYEVAIHFYQEFGISQPATRATLKVFVFGKLEAERTLTLDYAGQLWRALTIDWPSATLEFSDEVVDAFAPAGEPEAHGEESP